MAGRAGAVRRYDSDRLLTVRRRRHAADAFRRANQPNELGAMAVRIVAFEPLGERERLAERRGAFELAVAEQHAEFDHGRGESQFRNRLRPIGDGRRHQRADVAIRRLVADLDGHRFAERRRRRRPGVV